MIYVALIAIFAWLLFAYFDNQKHKKHLADMRRMSKIISERGKTIKLEMNK